MLYAMIHVITFLGTLILTFWLLSLPLNGKGPEALGALPSMALVSLFVATGSTLLMAWLLP